MLLRGTGSRGLWGECNFMARVLKFGAGAGKAGHWRVFVIFHGGTPAPHPHPVTYLYPRLSLPYHLPTWLIPAALLWGPYAQPHIPGYMHVYPALNHKHLPSVCTHTHTHTAGQRTEFLRSICSNIPRSLPLTEHPPAINHLALSSPHPQILTYLDQRTRKV